MGRGSDSMKRKPEAGRCHSSISDPSLEGSVPCYCILRWLYPRCLPWWAVPSSAKQMQSKHINISEHMKNKTQGPKRENQLCLLNVLSLKKKIIVYNCFYHLCKFPDRAQPLHRNYCLLVSTRNSLHTNVKSFLYMETQLSAQGVEASSPRLSL